MSRSTDNEKFARRVQALLASQGFYRGRIDGHAGRGTGQAVDALLEAKGWETKPKRSIWPAPDERSMTAFYGRPGTNLVYLELPYPMRLSWDLDTTVTRTRCHKLVADSLRHVLEQILDHYGGVSQVKRKRMDRLGGVFNLRRQRGGSDKWSKHAWGAAIDLDTATNGLRTPWPGKATMPVEVVDIFEAAGWLSGARAWKRDAMHFECTRR